MQDITNDISNSSSIYLGRWNELLESTGTSFIECDIWIILTYEKS